MTDDQHQAESAQKRIRRTAHSVMMCLGDHFVADHIEHRSACKSQRKWQDRARYTDRKEAEERAHDLNNSRQQRRYERPRTAHSRCEHRRNDDHAFGDILQRNAACDGQRLRGIARSEAYARRDPFGKIMDRDRHDEQQYLIELFGVFGMKLLIHARKPMQMRYELIHKAQAERTAEDPRNGHDDLESAAIFQ